MEFIFHPNKVLSVGKGETRIRNENDRRKQKREKDERRNKRKQAKARSKLLKRIAIFGVIIVAVATIGYLVFSTGFSGQNVGPLNSAHDHADFAIYIKGEAIDFAQNKYQIRSSYVHIEGGDGSVIHMHATNVELGYFLDTLDFEITPTSIASDDGRFFENGAGKELKVYINGEIIDDPASHIIQVLD